jgi:phosphoglycolate phosphatase
MLAALEADGAAWGIVTNKPEYLAREILPQLGWEARCAVLIGGDTLAEKKPHPLPLLVAAERMGFATGQCVYVGDDERDIQAARAATMPSIVALWGYRQDHEDPSAWGADKMLAVPADLLDAANWPPTP